MFFGLPWMLIGLLGLPALAAIYWLRSKAKQHVVSSLFLWMDQRRPRQGGRILQRIQTPLTFFLELLAIAAIVLAAAGPNITRSRFARPIILVLDDSYSMQAGKPISTRERAIQALADEFSRTEYVARVVLAADQPRLLGEPVRSVEQLRGVLEHWPCAAPTSALEPALALAAEIGGSASRILVVSDHPPETDLPAGKVQWWSFGKSLDNRAVTSAARDSSANGTSGQEDRVLLEMTNFGKSPLVTELSLEGANLETARRRLELGPGVADRLFLNVATDSPELFAKLPEDELTIDNTAVLVSPNRRPLRVQVDIDGSDKAGSRLRASVVRAIEACGQATVVESRADLVVCGAAPTPAANTWVLQILRGPETIAFEGPYILDRSHPLADGLSLDSIIWSAASKIAPTGTPVITAGNRVLLTDNEDATGRHALQMVFEPDLSNLVDNPDWPILFANLVRWRRAAMAGPASSNVRLGETLKVTLNEDALNAGSAVIVAPDDKQQTLPIQSQHWEIEPQQVGLYSVRAGSMEFTFACNAINASESDLTKCATGRWGDWNESEAFQDQRVSLDWALILVALVCLSAHMFVLSRAGAGGT